MLTYKLSPSISLLSLVGETLCQVTVAPLELTDDGFFLTVFDVKDQVPLADAASHQTFHTEKGIVAKFLSTVTFGTREYISFYILIKQLIASTVDINHDANISKCLHLSPPSLYILCYSNGSN